MSRLPVVSGVLLVWVLSCTAPGGVPSGGIGPSGGRATGASGASVAVPPGALAAAVDLAVGTVSEVDLPAGAPPGGVLRSALTTFTPHGTRFGAPVELSIPFQGEANAVFRLDDERDLTWEPVAGAAFEGGVATVSATSFSVYAVVQTGAQFRLLCAQWDGSRELVSEVDPATGALTPRGQLGNLRVWSGQFILNAASTRAFAIGGQLDGQFRRLPCFASGALDGGATPADAGSVTADAGVLVAQAVAAGFGHTCALEFNGNPVCFGVNLSGQSRPPAESLSSVSCASLHSCGRRTSDSSAVCWGDSNGGKATPPAGAFASVHAAYSFSCGLRPGGAVECWGTGAPTLAGSYVELGGGLSHVCGRQADGTIACAGQDNLGQATPPSGSFTRLGSGAAGYFTCALRVDGSIACWGANTEGQSTPPAGVFTAVATGGSHACALTGSGAVRCWGLDDRGQATPPAGLFTALAAGGSHTCGILQGAGEVRCWGANDYGQATPVGATGDAGQPDAGTGEPPDPAVVIRSGAVVPAPTSADQCLYTLDLATKQSAWVPVRWSYALAGALDDGRLVGLVYGTAGVEVHLIDPESGATSRAGVLGGLSGWSFSNALVDRKRGVVYAMTADSLLGAHLTSLNLTSGQGADIAIAGEGPLFLGVGSDGNIVGLAPQTPLQFQVVRLSPATGALSNAVSAGSLTSMSLSNGAHDPVSGTSYFLGGEGPNGDTFHIYAREPAGSKKFPSDGACTLARY